MEKKKSGLFITFEGIEGCGKTTQAKMLKDYLLKEGYPTLFSREPGGSALGEKIRKLLVEQVTSPVRWEQDVRQLLADGYGRFVEVGSGRVLTGLLRKIDRKAEAVNLSDASGLKTGSGLRVTTMATAATG